MPLMTTAYRTITLTMRAVTVIACVTSLFAEALRAIMGETYTDTPIAQAHPLESSSVDSSSQVLDIPTPNDLEKLAQAKDDQSWKKREFETVKDMLNAQSEAIFSRDMEAHARYSRPYSLSRATQS
ncbi:hypothetical protein PMIN03_000003 [Paraphaeosphaeria minitans]